MVLWYDVIGTILIMLAGMHFNVMDRFVVSAGLGMTAIFSLMDFKRIHPKRSRYEL